MSSFVRLTASTVQGFTEPLDGLEQAIPLQMIAINGGTFTMGSSSDKPGSYKAAVPQHTVTVPSFFMSRYPITQAQWRIVAAMPPVAPAQDLALDTTAPYLFEGGDDYPIALASWSQAVEFCDRLAQYSGRPYRLPSEAEWEYACRAGTSTPFAFGHTLTPELANYDPGFYLKRNGATGPYSRGTTPVNHFGVANAWGLCDMHGNVHEWCADHWHETYEGAPVDGSAWVLDPRSAWMSPPEGVPRVACEEFCKQVIRGGAWKSPPKDCRSATHNYTNHVYGRQMGFRVVCSVP